MKNQSTHCSKKTEYEFSLLTDRKKRQAIPEFETVTNKGKWNKPCFLPMNT